MNRITEILGSKYPIIQAPMGWIARSALASAVSNAGGFGIIETSSGELEECKQEIKKMSTLTNRPFGVNLPILFLRDESMINLVIEEKVKFVTTSAGDPAKYIHILKDAGIKVFHAVPSLAGALKAIKAGVDGLVVEGTEGGGFKNPEEVGLYVLLQSIRKHSDIPMVAAGGIVDGIGMAAAFAAGADAVMIGSLFAGTDEAPGKLIKRNGKLFKNFRGMGSVGAMNKGSADRYFQSKQKDSSKYVPEGVEGFAKYKGKVDNIIFKLIGGLRSSMGYLGSRQIKYLRDKPQFVKITKAGFYESMVHNVDIVKSDNKY
mgnify:CR=1 FL=1